MSTTPPDVQASRRGFIHRWNKHFGIWVVIALVLGAALGYLANSTGTAWLSTTLETIGDIFTSLLKFVVIPLVFTAIVVSSREKLLDKRRFRGESPVEEPPVEEPQEQRTGVLDPA